MSTKVSYQSKKDAVRNCILIFFSCIHAKLLRSALLSVLIPEQIVQCHIQRPADRNAQTDRRIVVTLFYRADRLSGHPAQLRQIVLRQILSGPCRFHPEILNLLQPSFLYMDALRLLSIHPLLGQEQNAQDHKHHSAQDIDHARRQILGQ